MYIYMPEIYWFDDRRAITCLDIQQTPYPSTRVREVEYNCDRYYKLATVGVSGEVRIWEYCYEIHPQKPLKVEFIANLDGHQGAVNCCKFSPNGGFYTRYVSGQYLASGDAYGGLITWFHCDETPLPEPAADLELPPNKENWKQYRKGSLRHASDVTCLAWSSCSQFLASASNDDSIVVQDILNGKVLWSLRNFRHFPVGLAWDPRGKYLVSFSTDRRLDILDTKKSNKLRSAFAVEKLNVSVNGIQTSPDMPYKLFHDFQLACFARTIDFSPCGSLLLVPTAHLELPGHNVYGTYVFRRSDLDKCRPHALIPSTKATILARASPVVYPLRKEVEENFLGLPYRVVFAVMTVDTVILHDSQSRAPFMYIDNLHYDNLTSLCWTPDGKSMAVSSMEGYNTFIVLPAKKMGETMPIPEEVTGRDSPILKKPKAPKAVKETTENTEEPKKKKGKKDSEEETTPKKTPSAKQSTPKSAATQGTPSLFKFFAPVNPKRDGSPVSSKTTMVMASKSKKKIETVVLGDVE
ncbi:hypothetical protein FO519_003895 [Halicephalobus sp. NKZ332]|nr:hypothetical protein FO519_003895 [Halicephalobus sp. NKZ332]